MRFTTVDPIRDGANWFAYVNNDPVNYVDLWGLLASEPERGFWSKVLDGVQTGLDVVGFVPGFGELADGINALISLGRGDVAGAALSATSMLPIVGDAIGKGGKIARAGLKYGNEITIVLEISDSSSTTIKAGEFVNRVFDSNYGKLEGVSGPLGRSFSPGSGINTTAKENIIERGLDI